MPEYENVVAMQGRAETKYSHLLHNYHVYALRLSILHSLYKIVSQLCQIGVEKDNDVCRRIHLFKSKKCDAAKYVLLANQAN